MNKSRRFIREEKRLSLDDLKDDHLRDIINCILSKHAPYIKEDTCNEPIHLSIKERERLKNWIYQQTKDLKNDN